MNIIVCVDDSLGMLFNNRRQSRDVVLINKIIEMSSSARLLINEFSKALFLESDAVTDENFLENASQGDFCFVENCHLTPYAQKIEKLIVFKWNRSYPSDFSLDIDLNSWNLIETTEFAGNSHEKITMEVYKK